MCCRIKRNGDRTWNAALDPAVVSWWYSLESGRWALRVSPMKCLRCGNDTKAFDQDVWWRKEFCSRCLTDIFQATLWDRDHQTHWICPSCIEVLVKAWILMEYGEGQVKV